MRNKGIHKKRRNHNWYLESLRRHKREKYLFYFLVFIAVILFAFAVYISRGT